MKHKQLSRKVGIVLTICITAFSSCTNSQGKRAGAGSIATDIHTAVITNNIAAVKQHIAAHSDLNQKDPFGGSSPLISAAVFGKTEIAKLLIDAGADIHVQNNDGSTALHSAAFFCRPDILQMLLNKKANKSIKNKYGATAYDNVSGPFNEVKAVYEMIGKALGPMGLKLDDTYLEKTRPVMAAMLK